MHLATIIFLIFILVVVLAVMTGYLTDAAATMTVGDDPNQIKAHNILTAASVLGWISIALILVVGFMVAYFGTAEFAFSSTAKWITYAFFGLCIILFVLEGILAAAAASNISQGADATSNSRQYNEVVGVAVFALGVTGILIIIWIYVAVTAKKKKQKQEDAQIEVIKALTATGK
jgi:hypothetical protein